MKPVDAPAGYVDADAIAAGYGMARGSVYRHASTDRWRRITRGRRTLYALDDVDITMARLDSVTSGEA